MQQIPIGSLLPANIAAALCQSVTMFGWTSIDGIGVPFIQRDSQKFFPVRIAENKFLSQFANVVQYSVQNPLLSHYMQRNEALALTNSGCGETFTTQDLLVNLEEFTRFYEEVKSKCSEDCSKKASVEGGWVQINNTVVPYIVKDDSFMISLAIVRCAAGLLVGRDVPVVYPDENECRFLNDSCKSAGIAFDFTTATELVELVLMSCMCDQRPFIQQLPSGNPFSVARPVVEESSNQVSANAGVSDVIQPINVAPGNALSVSPPPYSAICNQQPWLGNGSHSTGIQIVNTQSLVQDVNEYKSGPSAVLVSSASSDAQLQAQSIVGRTDYLQSNPVGSKNSPSYQDPAVASPHGGSKSSQQMLKEQWENSGVQQKCANNQNNLSVPEQLRQLLADVCKKNNIQVITSDASKAQPPVRDRTPNILSKNTNTARKRLPLEVDRMNALHESATDEEKQMQILQNVQVPVAIIPDSDDIRAGESLLLRRILCYGKTITCMVKHDKLYILLEAMNRLYFPMRRLDTVIKAVAESLRVPVMTLTTDEERDFMKFYKLPAERLNSNKVISVDDFVGVYRSLQSMLDNSFVTARCIEPKTAVETPATVNEGLRNSSIPVPVGIPVMNVSNLKLLQSQMASNNANDHSVVSNNRFPNAAQGHNQEKLGKFVNGMQKTAAIDRNATEDNSDQRPSKRCRTRVIGDVICIDD